jgi:hypothetical protein
VDKDSLDRAFLNLSNHVNETGFEADFVHLYVVNTSLVSVEENFLRDTNISVITFTGNDNLTTISPKAFQGSVDMLWVEVDKFKSIPDPNEPEEEVKPMVCPPKDILHPLCRCSLDDTDMAEVTCEGPEVTTQSLQRVFGQVERHSNQTGSSLKFASLTIKHSNLTSLDTNFMGYLSFPLFSVNSDNDMSSINLGAFKGSVNHLLYEFVVW